MSDIIKLKRSGVAAAVPSSLELGEVALNYADGKLFYKNSVGSIVEFGGGDALLRSLFIPPAPTSVTATAGNAEATVSWTAPSVLAQTPITDYVVQFRPAGGSWQTFSDGLSTSTSATVTGLTNGTAYEFSVAGVNAVGVGAYSAASSAVTPAAVTPDPYIANVELLLHMDGTGATFVDSSPKARTITAYGAATQSTAQSKFGGKSLALPSASASPSSDRLEPSGPDDFNFGTGDFTIEAFVYFNGFNGEETIAAKGNNFDEAFRFVALGAQRGLRLQSSNQYVDSANNVFTTGQWYHVAATRASGAVKLFVDGSQVASGTIDRNMTSNQPLTVGNYPVFGNYSAGEYEATFNGYIDELRITKGVARAITVPTAPYPDVVPGTDPYISNVSLLLHADGTGSTFVDSSPSPKTITASGGATQSAAQSRWGGKSLQLGGTGDYLEVSGVDISSGSYTVEFWFNAGQNHSGDNYSVLGGGNQSFPNRWGFDLGVSGGNILPRVLGPSNNPIRNYTAAYTLGTWVHVAFVNDSSGNTLSVYVNGVQVGQGAAVNFPNYGSSQVGRNGGSYQNVGSYYVDDLRVSAVARYTGSSITVPTAAFPDVVPGTDPYISSVSLLLHADGSGSTFVDSSPTPKTVTASGGATQSAAQSKFGGKSAYFDGSSRLTVPYSSAFDLSTGDWTVELWWRPEVNGDPNIISITPAGNSYAQVRIAAYSAGNFRLLCFGGSDWINTVTGGSWSPGNWYHLAAVRSGSQFYLFVDGVQAINYSSSASLNSASGATTIGAVDSSGGGPVTGHIDDVRVSKGIARYTANFTPPTAAFPDS